jgi:hypothetical protein
MLRFFAAGIWSAHRTSSLKGILDLKQTDFRTHGNMCLIPQDNCKEVFTIIFYETESPSSAYSSKKQASSDRGKKKVRACKLQI